MPPQSSSIVRETNVVDFLNSAKGAASRLKEVATGQSQIQVVSHFDADGIASGSIITKALWRLCSKAHLRIVPNVTETVLTELGDNESDLTVLTDIGSGYVRLIEASLPSVEIMILDHHPPSHESSHIFQVNPRIHGIDGSISCSGSTVSYIVARSISSENTDLSTLAVIGSLSDQQDKGPRRSLQGINEIPVQDAEKRKLISVSIDLLLYGRETRPLHKALASTTSPFLPGLTGKEDKSVGLLSEANIPLKNEEKWTTIASLTDGQKRILVSHIASVVQSYGSISGATLDLIGTVYTLSNENPSTNLRDGREFGTVLNACGRMGHPGLGVALCMGDRISAPDEADQLLYEYRRNLSTYLGKIFEDRSLLKRLGKSIVIRGDPFIEESMTGAVSSMISSSGAFPGTVTLVVTRKKDGVAKVSARGTDQLVTGGLDLGRILNSIAALHGGLGGGHNIAAGAEIPWESLEEFLRHVESEIRTQVP